MLPPIMLAAKSRVLSRRLSPLRMRVVSSAQSSRSPPSSSLSASLSFLSTYDGIAMLPDEQLDTVLEHLPRFLVIEDEVELFKLAFFYFANRSIRASSPSSVAVMCRPFKYFLESVMGAKPGDLPIEQTTRFFLAVNMKTAKTLDIVIPPSLLARTDEVIECICGFHACGIVAQC